MTKSGGWSIGGEKEMMGLGVDGTDKNDGGNSEADEWQKWW